MMNKRIEAFIRVLGKSREIRDRYCCGCGSSREVYALGDMVIKLPRNFFGDDSDYSLEDSQYDLEESGEDLSEEVSVMGILQNEKEIQVWNKASYLEKTLLAKIYCYGYVDGIPYIVMEKIEVGSDIGGFEFQGIKSVEEVSSERGFLLASAYKRIINILCDKYNLADGDLLGNPDNFGITRDKRLVISDYGFCGWSEDRYAV